MRTSHTRQRGAPASPPFRSGSRQPPAPADSPALHQLGVLRPNLENCECKSSRRDRMLQKNRSQSLRNRLYAGVGITNTTAQAFKNGEVHDWYRIALVLSDHLETSRASFIDLGIDCGASVIDPFCGSETTAVESMKRGIACWAVDANPMACFATRVKTTWDLDVAEIKRAVEEVVQLHPKARKEITELRSDKTYQYLKKNWNARSRWISPGALTTLLRSND